MRKLLALCFVTLFAASASAQQLSRGNVANGLTISYTPTINHGGVAPTAENVTGSWYKQIGSKFYVVGIVYTITTLGSPTSFIQFPLPTGLTAAVGASCTSSANTALTNGGFADIAPSGIALTFQPTTYAVQTYYITCMVPIQ